jgi:Pvc16 N-terminal domain
MTISKILDGLCKKIAATVLALYNVVVEVELSNIATVNDGDDFLLNKSALLLSIVNIEEDKTLRNKSLYKDYVPNSTTVEKFKKPAQHLTFSLLFTSYNKDQAKYSEGLEKLEYVMKYLQNNNVYYYDNLNLFEETEISENAAKLLNKIILDMITLKSEQLNQMWSYLGSRYMPSVLYTMRLIQIQKEDNLPVDTVVQKAKIQLWENDPKDPAGGIEISGDFTNE